MTCEASFMGGPADGQIRAFPGDEPPPHVTFDTFQRVGEQFRRGRFTYRRQVSELDEGPLWVFVPAPGEDPTPWEDR